MFGRIFKSPHERGPDFIPVPFSLPCIFCTVSNLTITGGYRPLDEVGNMIYQTRIKRSRKGHLNQFFAFPAAAWLFMPLPLPETPPS